MSGACDTLAANASDGVAKALSAVDCLANQTTTEAFGRLFGGAGALLPALTIVLTLYIAFFAISLLTGRTGVGISALMGRMMLVGLVLTFVTSWVAYQQVVWNLASGAPDQIAGVVTGMRGSATQIFAERIDVLFSAIADAANNAANDAAQAAANAAAPAAGSHPAATGPAGGAMPANLTWVAALLLVLSTAGVLVAARIALAVLLAVGPVFVIFALFAGMRGLFAGWLRGVVLTAVVPLFVVTGGGLMIELLVPIVASLGGPEGIDGRAALALFMFVAVYVVLMAMVLKVAGSVVSAWDVFGLSAGGTRAPRGEGRAPAASHGVAAPLFAAGRGSAPRRVVASMPPAAALMHSEAAAGRDGASARVGRMVVTQFAGTAASPSAPIAQRARGIGSRFRASPSPLREFVR